MNSFLRQARDVAGFLLLALMLSAMPGTATKAAINGNNLGAKYDGTQSNITFRVYSSRATRIEVWIYKMPAGAQEAVRYVLTKDAVSNVWSKTASVSTLQSSYGITGTVYYGYRAWGPNWPYSASWVKGSATGFISDVDTNGNRFNPNKLLIQIKKNIVNR